MPIELTSSAFATIGPSRPMAMAERGGPVLAILCLHLAALFVLPKSSFGLTSLRPEDLTGAALIAAIFAVAATGPLPLPGGGIVAVSASYLGYFWFVALFRDVSAGHYQAVVLWAKEVSYFTLGYLVWFVNRESPGVFLRAARVSVVPATLYGAWQCVTTPRGIYGVAPFGHELSPASSGMIYFAVSIVMWLSLLTERQRPWWRPAFFLSLILMLASGSKTAVVGAAGFYTVLLVEDALASATVTKIRRLLFFVSTSMLAITAAVVLSFSGYAPAGLSRYQSFISPLTVLAHRGIWWKINWVDGPASAIFGAGYSVAHLVDGHFSYAMAMDNEILYYVITGGVFGMLMYLMLMVTLFRHRPAQAAHGQVLRAIMISYALMGLGAEALQLSVFGNVFWMVVGLTYDAGIRQPSPSPSVPTRDTAL